MKEPKPKVGEKILCFIPESGRFSVGYVLLEVVAPEKVQNAMITASRQHSFLGIDGSGRVGVVRTAGNPNTHLVLRGGHQGPNYAPDSVFRASVNLRQAGINPRVLIDASHDNSGKNAERQPQVIAVVANQVRSGGASVLGIMLESHLVAGRQELKNKADLVYGQSITDACIDFPTTERTILALAEASAAGTLPAAVAASQAQTLAT